MIDVRGERGAARGTGGKVLFVAWYARHDPDALVRARELASSAGQPLVVLLCGRTRPRLGAWLGAWIPGADELTQVREAAEWIHRAVPGVVIRAERGASVEVWARVAAEIDASLIVLSARGLERPLEALALIAASGRPVLVARRPRRSRSVVAATDLRDRRLPVLSCAEMLTGATRSRLVAVHNVPSSVELPLTPDGHARCVGATPTEFSHRYQRLLAAARGVRWDVDAVLAADIDTSRAVLCTAHDLEADVVAVGAKPRHRIERWISRSVAESLLLDARASVLLAPVG